MTKLEIKKIIWNSGNHSHKPDLIYNDNNIFAKKFRPKSKLTRQIYWKRLTMSKLNWMQKSEIRESITKLAAGC